MSSKVLIAFVFVALSAPARAVAQTRAVAQAPEALQLEWSAPPGCPSGDAVRARVRQLIRHTEAADGSVVHAEGTITRRASGELHLHLLVRERELVGERHIESRSCRDLAASAAVALALLMRAPGATHESEAVDGAPTGQSGSGPAQPTVEPTTQEQASVRSSALGASSRRATRSWPCRSPPTP